MCVCVCVFFLCWFFKVPSSLFQMSFWRRIFFFFSYPYGHLLESKSVANLWARAGRDIYGCFFLVLFSMGLLPFLSSIADVNLLLPRMMDAFVPLWMWSKMSFFQFWTICEIVLQIEQFCVGSTNHCCQFFIVLNFCSCLCSCHV